MKSPLRSFVSPSHENAVSSSLADAGRQQFLQDTLAVILPAQVFIDRVRSGEINDFKTLLAGYWLAERRART